MGYNQIPPTVSATQPPSDPKEPACDDYPFPNAWPLTKVDHSLLGFGVLDLSTLESPHTAGHVLCGAGIKRSLTSQYEFFLPLTPSCNRPTVLETS